MDVGFSDSRLIPFLSLTEATFRLGDRLVFERTSWRFNRNEQWGITGQNGSGKSLFGDALRGRLPLIKGGLAWHFKPPAGFATEDCIGHVAFEDRKGSVQDRVVQSRWQSSEQDGAQTVRETLAYEKVMDVNPFEVTTIHEREKPRFERRLKNAIHLLEIERLLDRKLMVLSNGETQKVLLARELSRPLRLLILDEPFNGLDAASRSHFQGVLATLMSGTTRIVLITADPSALPAGISHVMQVEDCKVVAAGPRKSFESKHSTSREAPRTKTPENRHGRRSTISPASTLSRSRSPELVRMRDVSVTYGSVTILRNVNWTVRAGESWALLGPNGSGKTTLLSLIMGDHPQAYSNDITVLGHRIGSGNPISALKKKIGWISPELHLHFQDSFTVLETVESGFHDTVGLYKRVSPAQRREAIRWLGRFALKDLAGSPLYELSAGLQRSVLLIRALVKRPALLILDEPCQGLDPVHRALFVETVDSLIRDGKETAIYVTHRTQEIPRSIRQVLDLGRTRDQ